MIELKVLDINQITVGDRFRAEFGDMDTLVASIKKEGIIQPLAVKSTGNGTYTLLAGGRRHKACQMAGVTEIPVRIYPENISDLEMRSIELMENVARKDLSWVEATNLNKEIHLLQQKIYGKKISTSPDATGVGLRDTAQMLGMGLGTLSDDIKLANALEAFPSIREAKTKSDALKMLKKLQEEIVVSELAKRLLDKRATTPIEKMRNDIVNCFIIKDFFEGVSKVPTGSIDIVEIDPPYGINLHDIKRQDDTKSVTKNYNEVPAGIYANFIDKMFKECYRVMSENSWLICWFAQDPWFSTIYTTAIKNGFRGSAIPAIWMKENSSGQSIKPSLALANCYEAFFYFRKGTPSISRQGRSNVFSFKPVAPSKKIHPTERPVELIQEVLQTFSWEGCRVMVPFLGSGNTLLAALNLNMSAFGFDLTEEYKNAFVLRVNSGTPGTYHSYRE